ncbi:MAG TPA: hypothetical protein PKV16_04435 [Caldisericia bacterium]|nr:hypothetical protein [Caldisericia bacterium]HPF48557.1 hypothetical protein [Caldisericia bacterium]HPI83783.1 hypothetical protein [Caldisericia bacterium]HPQ93012.1 hypothetical protein [Caldisericia bacterium]HRV75155.1 hypothetical protein [Caldisericia bacterium]
MDTIQTPFTVLGEFKAQARISSIEISPDGGQTWFNCDVDEKTGEWSFHMSAPPGPGGVYNLISRATDKSGRIERTVNPNVDVRLRKRPLNVYIVPEGIDRE